MSGSYIKQVAKQLEDAIESDTEAIAALLRSCGSSRNFGTNEQRQFEQLLMHRRRLLAKIERLRERHNRMASGE